MSSTQVFPSLSAVPPPSCKNFLPPFLFFRFPAYTWHSITARRFGPWPKNRGVDAILKGNMEERACALALYIIENRTTVRAAAGRFGVSKSTVHKDLQERLPTFNRTLYLQVKQVLDENKAQRHIRGGMATREKYLHQHKGSKPAAGFLPRPI